MYILQDLIKISNSGIFERLSYMFTNSQNLGNYK